MDGYRPQNRVAEKSCTICGKGFIPYRESDFCCGKICALKKDAINQSARRFPSQSKKHRRNVIAEWRRKNPARTILSRITSRHKETDIDVEWIQERLDRGVCEVTGIKFEFPSYGILPKGFNYCPWTPSMDRIDPDGLYEKENCRLVVWAYNRARGKWDDEVMRKLAFGIIQKGEI